jgi:hypothetical protein
MKPEPNTVTRRAFLGGLAAASAFSIVPRHVLGGARHVPPSDKIVLAQIGCGTQAQRQVNAGLITREDVHLACVCDPNTDTANYVDWSPNGNRNAIRKVLEDPTWGEGDTGIRAGREVARQIIEAYYGKVKRSGTYAGVRSYADFRELLEKETDIDGVISITPDHQHAVIAIAAMKKGKAAISHKPVANVLHEVRQAVQASRERPVVSHLLAYSNNPDRYTLDAWIKAGVIGPVREVHNWTNRPFWPQGWRDYYREGPPVPAGFDWDLWLGPEPHRPYHPDYTFALYRGWYAFGGGCLADMGHYSLWQPYRILDLDVPESVEARPNVEAWVREDHVSTGGYVSTVGFPRASTIRWRHPAKGGRPAVDVFWYDGGMKPATPEELYEDNEDLTDEGMLFVGDQGKILCDFRGNKPRLIPGSRMRAFEGSVKPDHVDTTDANDEWIKAIAEKGTSRGSFSHVAPLAEAVCLGNIALRVPYRRLLWDAGQMAFTNVPEANQYVRRAYRPGWEV